MNSNLKPLSAAHSLTALLSGCATLPPASLVNARAAYVESSEGQVMRLAPTELYDAKKVLDKANSEFAANGDTLAVRDYAYITARKLELAEVKARTEVNRRQIALAGKEGLEARDDQVKSGQAALADSREQVQQERAASAEQGRQLDRTTAQLESEKLARGTAEARLAGAMKDLATIASVKEEPRGLVITLSGSVLFASGRYTLFETAKTRLDQVAAALKEQSPDKLMSVEGHTDSQGSDAVNLPLSLNRANVVRDYLVTRGVDPSRITAVGFGSTRPLVDNLKVENRANNRRVEIVIHPAPVSIR
jgi:outer membrane protein OmpA-like peptidoglycan-associated protein